MLCTDFNLSDTSEVCVKITTGTNKHNDGTLKLTIDGVLAADDSYEKGAVVIDSCFCNLNTIEISNPSIDGWSGRILIKHDGKPTSISCVGCSGSSSLPCGDIAVDGDWDSTTMADTQCLGGNTCSLAWEIKGILSTVKYIPTHCFENNILFIMNFGYL